MFRLLKYSELYISEKIINAFDDGISLYANELYDMLKKSYESIGGFKGKGLSSTEDLIKNIKMVKMVRRNGRITASMLYKDKKSNGRKTVAFVSNGTPEGKNDLRMIIRDDFRRSYFEISSALLRFIEKNFPNEFDSYKIKNTENLEIFDDIIPVDEYFYKRKIGDEYITKIAVGTPNIKFY